jgi:hypothetical protein
MPLAGLAETAAWTYEHMDWRGLAWDVVQPTAPLYMTILYLTMMSRMKPASKEFVQGTMKPFLKKYNFAMSAFSGVCTVVMATAISEVWPLYGEDCDAAWRNPKWNAVFWAFYVSKFVEYIDSWSLHVAGKHVSWLQFLHHLGAPWMMWFGINYRSEPGWTVVLFNSFVHFVMYAYYYGTMCGYRPRCKPLLTLMQITQFVSAFALVWPYRSMPCMQDPANAGKAFAFIYCWGYVGVVLFLFMNFALYNYVVKPRGKRAGK